MGFDLVTAPGGGVMVRYLGEVRRKEKSTMNKKQLIEALNKYPDDAEVRIWTWTKNGSKYFLTNPTLTNNPDVRADCFDLSLACEVTDLMRELRR